FLHPVDTNIVTDYLTVIKHPMDFSTMQQKVDRKIYRSVAEFKDDLTLLCQNAKTYNAPATPYYKLAEKL
ncbi:Bromodomain-containing protein, partial [Paraphysoderma sedebokerense]